VENVVDLQITLDERVPFRSVFEAHKTPIDLVGRETAASRFSQNRSCDSVRAQQPRQGDTFQHDFRDGLQRDVASK
jgi:hypothetical protein